MAASEKVRLRKKYFRNFLCINTIRACLQWWIVVGRSRYIEVVAIEHNEIYLFEVKKVSLGQALALNR